MPLSHCDTWIVDRQWAYSVQRVPDCLGGLSRVGISTRSTRPWNGQPPSSYDGCPFEFSAVVPLMIAIASTKDTFAKNESLNWFASASAPCISLFGPTPDTACSPRPTLDYRRAGESAKTAWWVLLIMQRLLMVADYI